MVKRKAKVLRKEKKRKKGERYVRKTRSPKQKKGRGKRIAAWDGSLQGQRVLQLGGSAGPLAYHQDERKLMGKKRKCEHGIKPQSVEGMGHQADHEGKLDVGASLGGR